MFDHVTIRVSDREASDRFYATVLAGLGISPDRSDFYTQFGAFGLAPARDEHPVSRNLHVAFSAPSPELVDEFWRAGTEAGYTDDGAPGPRTQYGPDYYGGFLRDPDGNSVEAVHNGDRERHGIDHLWLRVADPQASKAFYATIAPHAGIRLGTDTPERVSFTGPEAPARSWPAHR